MFKTGKLEIGTSAQIKFNEEPKNVENYTTTYDIDHALKYLNDPTDALKSLNDLTDIFKKFPIGKYQHKG
jgi:hypothetical protein